MLLLEQGNRYRHNGEDGGNQEILVVPSLPGRSHILRFSQESLPFAPADDEGNTRMAVGQFACLDGAHPVEAAAAQFILQDVARVVTTRHGSGPGLGFPVGVAHIHGEASVDLFDIAPSYEVGSQWIDDRQAGSVSSDSRNYQDKMVCKSKERHPGEDTDGGEGTSGFYFGECKSREQDVVRSRKDEITSRANQVGLRHLARIAVRSEAA